MAKKPKQKCRRWRFMRKTVNELDWDEHAGRPQEVGNKAGKGDRRRQTRAKRPQMAHVPSVIGGLNDLHGD